MAKAIEKSYAPRLHLLLLPLSFRERVVERGNMVQLTPYFPLSNSLPTGERTLQLTNIYE
jgi:hypothetical protein